MTSKAVSESFPTLMVVPSGIGCAIGGFAGDAIPAARLLAAASGCLITHPNVLNAASLYWRDSRLHYVEGYSLDRFAAGEIALRPVRKQRIGLILDRGIETELLYRHLQVVDACRTSLGLDIGPITKTDLPLEVRLNSGYSGISWGDLLHPDALLRAGRKLINSGATALAVVTRFPDDHDSEIVVDYRRGTGVDALAGAEAVISHLLVKEFGLPCAHAPALSPLPLDHSLDPRAAGEELGYSFLPCVLVGLSSAPDLVSLQGVDNCSMGSSALDIKPADLAAIVAPVSALGGEAVLACIEKGVPLITVENPTSIDVNPESLGIDKISLGGGGQMLLRARNYPEAAGLIMLLREGINVQSLFRPVCPLEIID